MVLVLLLRRWGSISGVLLLRLGMRRVDPLLLCMRDCLWILVILVREMLLLLVMRR